MKFVVSSTVLLKHLESISRSLYSSNNHSCLNDYLIQFGNIPVSTVNEFNFNELYTDYNFLLKILKTNKDEIRISKYEKEKDQYFGKYKTNIKRTESLQTENLIAKQTQKLDFSKFLSGYTKQLIRLLAIYIGRIQSNLFKVLRNTRIHSLSIFFGLCCSRSGYIFEAITGASSHPVPVK